MTQRNLGVEARGGCHYEPSVNAQRGIRWLGPDLESRSRAGKLRYRLVYFSVPLGGERRAGGV
ncbi:MAG: hypothetical protein JW751_25080 [Polyangiaceae bacterium]|nr:hypothetical protein [Polyangiaceae bacterium]